MVEATVNQLLNRLKATEMISKKPVVRGTFSTLPIITAPVLTDYFVSRVKALFGGLTSGLFIDCVLYGRNQLLMLMTWNHRMIQT